MKAREKSMKTHTNFLDFNCSASQFSCNKHPYSSSVGICPHCLNDRLMKLVCSDCGEHRVSSCSCSEISSSYRNSCSNIDVGSVGRISFLIENDKIGRKQRSFLGRSSSNCVEAKKSYGFCRIKKLFTKRSNKEFYDQNSESSSYLDGDSYKQYGFSNGYEARKRDKVLDDENGGFGLKKVCCPNQVEMDRVCSVFPIKERDLSAMDESEKETGFIELKPDSSCDGYRNENLEVGEILQSLKRNGICGNGGSCRITMNERGFKQKGSTGNYKLWKWIFKYRAAAREGK
ncbi:hypothetical protein C2S51_033592 [Perilla frutescens var. frutescens]|nr:hypothetical protein C2S51_033592 [Perilla frutescens var. frutescens]